MWVRKGTLKLNPPWETKPTQRKRHCLGKLLGSDWTTPRTKSKWSCALEVYWHTWILRWGAVPEFHFLLLGREGENFQFKIGGEHFFINEVCPQEKILHQMSDLSPCLFYVAVKITMTKANYREEGLFFLIWYGSSLRKVRKRTYSRDSWKWNRNRGHWGKLFPCLASRPMFNFFSCASQSNLPRDGTAHSCLSPLLSFCNQESTPTDLPTGKSDTGHPSAEAPSSQVYQQNN